MPFRLDYWGALGPSRPDGQPATWAEFHHAQIGDVTGDGRDDLMSLGQTDDPVRPWMLYVYPQLPSGALAAPQRYLVNGNDPVMALSLADMNNDGTEDVVITHLDSIAVFVSKPDGTLRAVQFNSTTVDRLSNNTGVVAIDENEDGYIDLVSHLSVAWGQSLTDARSRFRIDYGDGLGGSAGHVYFGAFGSNLDRETVSSLVTGDFNNDGHADLAAASMRFDFAAQQNPLFLSIYLHKAGGGFGAPTVSSANVGYGETLMSLDHLVTGDFNGDGRDDLAATSGIGLYPKAWVYLQNASAVNLTAFSYARQVYHGANALAAFDVNRDGRDDLLMAHTNQDTLGYLLQSQGALADETQLHWSGLGTDIPDTGLAAGDLNSDGCTDVAFSNRYLGLHIWRGSHCAPRVTSGTCQARRVPILSSSHAYGNALPGSSTRSTRRNDSDQGAGRPDARGSGRNAR